MQHVITSEFHPEARDYIIKHAILYVFRQLVRHEQTLQIILHRREVVTLIEIRSKDFYKNESKEFDR